MQFSPLLVDTVNNLHADFLFILFLQLQQGLATKSPVALYIHCTYITEMASSTEVEYDIHGLIYKKTGEHVE